MTTLSSLVIRPLQKQDGPLLERLFGAKGACGGCWCMYWRFAGTGKAWQAAQGEPNKRQFLKAVKEGTIHGILAIAGDEPVGWCSLGPVADFPRLARSPSLRREWQEGCWSVNCFFVSRRYRGQGLARRLLRSAVQLAREQGAREIEGYPIALQANETWPGAFIYTGTLPMFEAEGFRRQGAASTRRQIMLRTLRPARAQPQQRGERAIPDPAKKPPSRVKAN